MIKRIELVNFMSHRHTVIDLAEGLTVLVGPNNCGKSAVVAALRTLAFNENSTFVTRHGEKTCAVRLETVDGNGQTHQIEWSRTKNSSRYKLDGELFDRLKGRVPEQVTQALQIAMVDCENESFDVHFGEQKEPVFLLKNSGRAAAEFFASASDAVHLSSMQRIHKNRVAEMRNEKTVGKAQLDLLQQQQEWLEPIESLDVRLQSCELIFDQLRESEREIATGFAIAESVDQTLSQQLALEMALEVYETLAAPPQIDEEQPLENLLESMRQTEVNQRRLASEIQVLRQTPEPLELQPTERLEQVIVDLKRSSADCTVFNKASTFFQRLASPPEIADVQGLAKLVEQMQFQLQIVSEQTRKSLELQQLHEHVSKTIQQWIDDHPACPTCGATIASGSGPAHDSCSTGTRLPVGSDESGGSDNSGESLSVDEKGNPIPIGLNRVPKFLRSETSPIQPASGSTQSTDSTNSNQPVNPSNQEAADG